MTKFLLELGEHKQIAEIKGTQENLIIELCMLFETQPQVKNLLKMAMELHEVTSETIDSKGVVKKATTVVFELVEIIEKLYKVTDHKLLDDELIKQINDAITKPSK